jgi:hypothetical protein
VRSTNSHRFAAKRWSLRSFKWHASSCIGFTEMERNPLVPLGFDDLLSIARSYLMQSFSP